MPLEKDDSVLVVGAGYVGSALVLRLHAAGAQVIALGRRPRAATAGERIVTADVLNPASLTAIDTSVHYVIYLVSPDDASAEAYRAAYVDGLRNLLACSALRQPSLRRVLFASSTAVYGQCDGSWVDERSKTVPTSFHGERLLEAERLLGTSGVPHTIVRFAGIYGPGRQRLLTSVMEGTAVVSLEPSWTNRIHRDDCAGLLMHLMQLDSPDSLYLGVDNEPADMRLVLEWLARTTQSRPPAVGERAQSRRRPGSKRCSNRRVSATGYQFAYPTFREGYAELIRGMHQ
jgi:nucleoside-diphosphate-sugar epimerase